MSRDHTGANGWSGASIADFDPGGFKRARKISLDQLLEENAAYGDASLDAALAAIHTYVNSGMKSIILTAETMDQLLGCWADCPPLCGELAPKPGAAFELLFSRPTHDMDQIARLGHVPDTVGGIVFCPPDPSPREQWSGRWMWIPSEQSPREATDNTSPKRTMLSPGLARTSSGSPRDLIEGLIWADRGPEFKKEMLKFLDCGKYTSVFLATAALRALLNPAVAYTQTVKLKGRARRRRAHAAGQSIVRLTLRDSARGTLRIVRIAEQTDPPTSSETPAHTRAEHDVGSHSALCWVLAPYPGERVEGKRISRTYMIDGKEHHTWLYGVRRPRKAHTRGRGPRAEPRPKLIVLQGVPK